MTEISVIKHDDVEAPLSAEEREVMFRKLAKELNISYDYFEQLARLEDLSLEREVKSRKPEILVLLLRRILEFKCVIPIIRKNRPAILLAEEIDKTYNLSGSKTRGGLNSYSIPIQLNGPQTVVLNELPDVKKYMWTKGETIDVCGVYVDEALPLEDYFLLNVPGNMSFASRISSGHFNYEYLHSQIFAPFYNLTERRLAHNLPGIVSESGFFYVLFDNEKSANGVCQALFDILQYLSRYHLGSYISDYINLAKEGSLVKSSLLFRSIGKIFDSAEPVISVRESKPEKIIAEYAFLSELDIFLGKFINDYEALWFDMMSANSELFLQRIIMINKLPPGEQKKKYQSDIEEEIGRIKEELFIKAQIIQQKKQIARNILDEKMIRWIYRRKFGNEKLLSLMKNMPQYGTTRSAYPGTRGKLFEFISKKEQEIITLGLQNYQNQQKSQESWVGIVKKLRTATQRHEIEKYYRELKPYLQKPKAGQYYLSKEGYQIICPHVVEKIELELSGRTDYLIHEIIQKYAGDIPIYQAYYCYICGEVITYNEQMEGIVLFEGNQPNVLHNLEEGLKDYIWKIASQIVRNFVQFKNLHTNKFINDFTTSVVNRLHEFIYVIDKKLRQVKTITHAEIDLKIKLFTTIYVYALLVKVIHEHPTSITFTGLSKSGFAKVEFEKIIQFAANKVSNTQNVVINKLPDIDDNFIESSLRKTYKNLEDSLGKTSLKPPPELDPAAIWLMDPTYLYLKQMILWMTGNFRENTEILSQIPSFPEKTAFDDLDSKKLREVRGPRLLAEIKKGYRIRSFQMFVDYLTAEIYLHPPSRTVVTRDAKNENIYYIVETPSSEYEKYRGIHQYILNNERILRDIEKFYLYRTYTSLPFRKSIQFSGEKRNDISNKLLSRIYGYKVNPQASKLGALAAELKDKKDKFHKHKWNICAFAKLQEYPSSIYHKGVTFFSTGELRVSGFYAKHPEAYNLKLVDMICDICLFSMSEAESDTFDISKILVKEQSLTSFYNYYENRCPGSPNKIDFHSFEKDKCKYCGINKDIIASRSLEYYDKYISKFEQKEISYSRGLSINSDFSPKTPQPTPQTVDWKENTHIANEFSSKTYDLFSGDYKKNEYYNIIVNLALVEKYEYSQIINGKEAPYRDMDPTKARARYARLDMYMRELIFDYYTLVNYKNLAVLPVEFGRMVESLSVKDAQSLVKLPDLHELLGYKESYVRLLEKHRRIFIGDEITKLAHYVLEFLLRTILELIRALEKTINKKFAAEFAEYFVAKLVNMEKTSSKLKEVKTAIVESQHEQDIMSDPNMQDHRQSRAYDGLVDHEIDKYSFSEVDMEDQAIDDGLYNVDF